VQISKAFQAPSRSRTATVSQQLVPLKCLTGCFCDAIGAMDLGQALANAVAIQEAILAT